MMYHVRSLVSPLAAAMNFATDADMAVALLARVEELRRHPVELVGENVERFHAPNGTWRIRCVLREGRFSTMVYKPDRTRLYAMSKLLEHLAPMLPAPAPPPAAEPLSDSSESDVPGHGVEGGSKQEEGGVARHGAARPLLDVRAVLTIQSRVRSWRVHRSVARIRALRTEHAVLTTTLEQARQRLRDNEDDIALATSRLGQQWSCTLSTVDVETRFVLEHPSVVFAVLPRSFETPTTAPTTGGIRVLPGEETGLTRAAVVEVAQEYVHTYPVGSISSVVGKAVTKEPHHFPLLLGPLPPPRDGLYRRPSCYVRVSHEVLPSHGRLLSRKFGKSWRTHVQAMLTQRPHTVVLDVAADRNENQYLGSVVVAKMLVRANGLLSPAISIESIVASVENDGTGGKLMSLCHDVLWADVPTTVRRGYVYAQCLDVGFWVTTLELTNAARALALQAHMVYPSYHLDESCHVRGGVVDRYPDVPSPEKKLG